jgi:hypothetical protein
MNIKLFVKTQTFGKLPAFIKEHSIFSKINKIEKPFKAMGLFNAEEPLPPVPYPDYHNYRIGFSASGAQGLWDLATMSMRGAMSCMHWKNGHSCHLIGSVIDPFLGIIYLTDGAMTPYGVSFRRRCLVRVVYRNTSKQFALMLERPYFDTGNTVPTNYANADPTAPYTLEIFKKYLSDKIQGKYQVITSGDKEYYDYIPYPTGISHLISSEISMSDCRLSYLPLAQLKLHAPAGADLELISKCADQN